VITATAANTQESGNQRSAKFEQRRAKRAERLSVISAAMGSTSDFLWLWDGLSTVNQTVSNSDGLLWHGNEFAGLFSRLNFG
jgi:hypothetical protein